MHDLCYKTTAKKVFFLDDSDLSTLPSTATDNPHNGGGATLYEKADVVDLVVQQYGERDAWDEMMARKQESKNVRQYRSNKAQRSMHRPSPNIRQGQAQKKIT